MRLALSTLDADLAGVPGTVSVWCGPVDGPAGYARLPHATHYAASTMKVAVLAAAYRLAEAGIVDLDAAVPVRNEFVSAAPGAGPFGCDPDEDNDPAVWERLGGTAPLRWLAQRMIVRSSNLAADIVLSRVGLDAVARVWRLVGAAHSVTARGIEDVAAREAGITNLVTAADLATLFNAITAGAVGRATRLAGPAACRGMLGVLLAQERREDLAAGLPPGTRVALKNGWVHGLRHSAGVVFPTDAPPYTLVVCVTSAPAGGAEDDPRPAGDDPACQLIAHIAAVSWADRHRLAQGPR